MIFHFRPLPPRCNYLNPFNSPLREDSGRMRLITSFFASVILMFSAAVSDGLVYAVGTYLNIACFDAANGSPIWAHDSEKEFGAALQLNTGGIKAWGCANSPVIDGNLLFVHCGGSGQALMAFDKKTGKV